MEDGDPVRDAEAAAEAVCRHHHRAAASLEGQEELAQPFPAALVEFRERLVQEQQPRVSQHDSRERQAPLHPRGECAHTVVRRGFQLHLLKGGHESAMSWRRRLP